MRLINFVDVILLVLVAVSIFSLVRNAQLCLAVDINQNAAITFERIFYPTNGTTLTVQIQAKGAAADNQWRVNNDTIAPNIPPYQVGLLSLGKHRQYTLPTHLYPKRRQSDLYCRDLSWLEWLCLHSNEPTRAPIADLLPGIFTANGCLRSPLTTLFVITYIVLAFQLLILIITCTLPFRDVERMRNRHQYLLYSRLLIASVSVILLSAFLNNFESGAVNSGYYLFAPDNLVMSLALSIVILIVSVALCLPPIYHCMSHYQLTPDKCNGLAFNAKSLTRRCKIDK